MCNIPPRPVGWKIAINPSLKTNFWKCLGCKLLVKRSSVWSVVCMLGPLMKNGFGCNVQSTLIVDQITDCLEKVMGRSWTRKGNNCSSQVAEAKARYSASDEDFATVGWFFGFPTNQWLSLPKRNNNQS